MISSQVKPIALHTKTVYCFTSKWRTDKNFGKTSTFNIVSYLGGDQKSLFVDNLAIFVLQVACEHPATNIFRKRNFNSGNIFTRDHFPFFGATIIFSNDHILRHIHQPTSQIPGLGGVESSVGCALSSAMRNNEIFNRRKSFLVTGNNWKL